MKDKHYCSMHIALEATYGKRPAPKRRQSSEWHELYNSARWRKARQEFLNAFPFCVVCGEPAKVVDHIRPHRGNIELFYNPDNWQPLCITHHNAKTLQENGYFHKKPLER